MRIIVSRGEVAAPVPISIVATRAGVPVEVSSDVLWLQIDNSSVIAPGGNGMPVILRANERVSPAVTMGVR